MRKSSALHSLALALTLASTAAAQPAPPAAPAKPNEEKPKPAAEPAPRAPAAAPADEAEGEDEAEAPGELPPAPTRPSETQPGGQAPPSLTPMPMWPEPGSDAAALKKQGSERPGASAKKAGGDQVFAEDWWSHARPIFELHGYFRVRSELFHHFSLGRADDPQTAIWPRPADNHYTIAQTQTPTGPTLCTADEAGLGSNDDPAEARFGCKNGTQTGANLRFRLNPELHVSDNLRVRSQIDLLDNLVLGSTPGGYSNAPAGDGGYAQNPRPGYAPLSAFDDSQVPPASAVNSLRDSISVKRAWAEYATPLGELRFGRMPAHFGLGILDNSGDGPDDNYQSNIDRVAFVTGIKALDLYVAAAWDFPSEGPTSDNISINMGQPYDVAQLDDVDQYMLSVARKKSPELTRLALSRGDLVLNGGIQVYYRTQLLDGRLGNGTCSMANGGAPTLGCQPGQLQFVRRGYNVWTPDLWFQLLYRGFRFELEAVTVQGTIENVEVDSSPQTSGAPEYDIREYGIATEIEQRLVEDRLRLGFNFGWASGDPDVGGANEGSVGGLTPPRTGFQQQIGDRTISTFRFHPAYDVDLILYRNILTRVQGTYYFRPSVEYDFVRDLNGQKIGGGLAAIWSRASEFMQAPGHEHDLGVELDVSLYYQSKDGALNDDPSQMGGFFAMVQYGALFPMAGLGYPDKQAAELNRNNARPQDNPITSTNMAQTLRLYLGVFF
jgi:uncharacterized protein (TIGR04551 family)